MQCFPDQRRGRVQESHCIDDPESDTQLQAVLSWLTARPLAARFTNAADDAIRYVLDGARTGRFDLEAPDVDSDERATVGTKLQYRVLNELGLHKEPPLDTWIEGVPVEIKATTRTNWMIPTEGQCQVSILLQLDVRRARHRAFLIRAHRGWLNEGANKDGKRSIAAEALVRYARPLLDWTPLPPEPLKLLTVEQRRVVFAPRVGQTSRLVALFRFLPNTVIPRASIETVCFGNKDPMRRARQAKERAATSGLEVLVGTWRDDRARAKSLGFELSNGAWVAIDRARTPIDVEPGEVRLDWSEAESVSSGDGELPGLNIRP